MINKILGPSMFWCTLMEMWAWDICEGRPLSAPLPRKWPNFLISSLYYNIWHFFLLIFLKLNVLAKVIAFPLWCHSQDYLICHPNLRGQHFKLSAGVKFYHVFDPSYRITTVVWQSQIHGPQLGLILYKTS